MVNKKKGISTATETPQASQKQHNKNELHHTSRCRKKRRAEYIEIACDRLLGLRGYGISKVGACSLFGDGAFNTTVSRIYKTHHIFLARERRALINRHGTTSFPMFYWISDKEMARRVIKLSNKLKVARGAEAINEQGAMILLADFPEKADTLTE